MERSVRLTGVVRNAMSLLAAVNPRETGLRLFHVRDRQIAELALFAACMSSCREYESGAIMQRALAQDVKQGTCELRAEYREVIRTADGRPLVGAIAGVVPAGNDGYLLGWKFVDGPTSAPGTTWGSGVWVDSGFTGRLIPSPPGDSGVWAPSLGQLGDTVVAVWAKGRAPDSGHMQPSRLIRAELKGTRWLSSADVSTSNAVNWQPMLPTSLVNHLDALTLLAPMEPFSKKVAVLTARNANWEVRQIDWPHPPLYMSATSVGQAQLVAYVPLRAVARDSGVRAVRLEDGSPSDVRLVGFPTLGVPYEPSIEWVGKSVYLAWSEDVRVNGRMHSVLRISSSTDRGDTWSAPIVVAEGFGSATRLLHDGQGGLAVATQTLVVNDTSRVDLYTLERGPKARVAWSVKSVVLSPIVAGSDATKGAWIAWNAMNGSATGTFPSTSVLRVRKCRG
jgi:hypothetical protein